MTTFQILLSPDMSPQDTARERSRTIYSYYAAQGNDDEHTLGLDPARWYCVERSRRSGRFLGYQLHPSEGFATASLAWYRVWRLLISKDPDEPV